MGFWNKLSIQSKFMMLAAGAIIIGLSALFGWLIAQEKQRILATAHEVSVSAVNSINDLVVQTMTTRPDDPDDIGIQMYNSWFDRRNEEFDGQLWTAWTEKVVTWQRDLGEEPIKEPRDDVDREAVATKRVVERVESDRYRMSFPVVLGETRGADQEVCYACHGAMGLEKGEVIAVLSSAVDLKDEFAALDRQIMVFVAIWVVAVAATIGGAYVMLTWIVTTPIKGINRAMTGLAEGDLTSEIAGRERVDVIGEMARAVQVFKEKLIHNQEMAAAQERQQQAERARVKRLEELTGAFEQRVGEVIKAVTRAAEGMRASAESLVRNAEQAAGQAEHATGLSKQSANNSSSAARAAESLSSSIASIEKRIAEASARARHGVAQAERTNETVERLAAGANRIGSVIAMIDDVAEKTNLLALNATVEAARAGEAGKSFAVVANEVQNLAHQTKKATGSITAQIDDVRKVTHEAVEAIKAIAADVLELDRISSEVAVSVQQQNASTGQIASSVQETAKMSQDVSASMGVLTQAAASTDAGANDVLGAANGLAAQAETLERVVETFLDDVRKA